MKRLSLGLVALLATILTVLLVWPVVSAVAAPARSGDISDPPSAAARTIDELFAEVAKRIPGFAGVYVDDNDNDILYVRLLDPSRKEEAVQALTAVFGPERVSSREVRTVEAQYGFLELKGWYGKMASIVLALPGVVLTDIDEGKNRLEIGLEKENEQTRSLIGRELDRLGVPRQAVIIEVSGPVELASHTLQDYVRPLDGGLQIENDASVPCTLGFNARRGGVLGIVTNSHCTRSQGGVENTVFSQPRNETSPTIGVETVDPLYWTGGECPAGRECRYSDSAFVRLYSSDNANLGYIARPTDNNGSLTINHNDPRFRIVNENPVPYQGDLVNKVGKTTGWSQGNVYRTCIDVNVDNTNFTFICQDEVSADVDEGDSGSPVFKITNSPSNGDVSLYGLVFGKRVDGFGTKYFTFSRIAFVQRVDELGTMDTCASGGC